MKKQTNFPWLIILITLFVSLLYALIRYEVFGSTLPKDTPLYIGNKVLAISGLIFLVSYFYNNKNYYLGGLSYLFILGHIIINLMLLNPVYFNNLYDADTGYTANANLSLFFGVVAFLLVWVFHQIKKGNTLFMVFPNNVLQILIVAGIGLHLFFIGFSGWVQPGTWKGFMPPITLIGFIIILSSLFKRT